MRTTKTGSSALLTQSVLGNVVRAILRQCSEVYRVSSAGGLILGSLGAHAQSTPASSPALPTQQPQTLEEVVVTAQRRSQSVQDVPYNITAVDSSQIQASGATTLNDLTRVVPGLTTVDEGEGARGGTNNFTLRGLRTDSPGGGRSPAEEPGQTVSSVSTYFGETPVFFPMPLYDVNRVEVLRGPQGTLYGSGAQAGTIRFIPNRPDFDKFSGEVQLTGSATQGATEFDNLNRDVKGFVNIPLADHLALRAVAGWEHDGGFIESDDLWARQGSGYDAIPTPRIPGNLTSGPVLLPPEKNTNTTDQWFARGALRWQPVDPVDLQVDYLHQFINSANTQTSNPGYAGGPLDLTTPVPGNVSPTNPGRYPDSTFIMRPGGTYVSTAFTLSPYQDTIDLVSGVATVDVGFATVTSATSYYDDTTTAVSDFTAVLYNPAAFNFNAYPPYNFYPRILTVLPSTELQHSFIQELRLVSSGENRVDYVVGAYFQRQIGLTQTTQFFPGIQQYLDYIGQPNPSTYGDIGWIYDRGTEFEDRAAFGEVTLHATHNWQVTAGARTFKQTFDTSATSMLPLCGAVCAGNLTDPTGLSVSSASSDVSKTVKKFNSAYDLTPELKIYATYAEGFRRGGANALPLAGAFATLPTYQTFAPDLAKNYEIGVKGTLFDRKIRYSADVYLIHLENFQFNALSLAGYPATYNGTEARSQGVELELQAALSRSTSATFGYTYTDATVMQTFNLADYPPYALIPSYGGTGETASVLGGPITAGTRLPGVPEDTFSASIDQTVPLAALGAHSSNSVLTLHLDGAYRSWSSGYIQPTSAYNWRIPGSFMGNARATADTGGPMAYDLFVTNFTDSAGYSGGQYAQAFPNYARFRNVARPRTYGIGLRYRF
jgi:iron complex outermembrane recepter protein